MRSDSYDEEDDDGRPDFFDGEDIEEPEKKRKKTYEEDDPRFWIESEDTWDHLPKGRPRFGLWVWISVSVAALILIIGVWLRYFHPCVEGATQAGYVESIERRGAVFGTYEGVLLPYKELMDTNRVYARDFTFTVQNSALAAKIKTLMLKGKPVRVEYRRYYGTLPWRGASNVIVTSADSVNPALLLPPDRNPLK